MDNIDLNDYVAGGYFVAKPIQRETWMSVDLLPEQITTLSSCLNKSKVQIYWGWHTDNPSERIAELGISNEKLDNFKRWSASDEVGFPNVFYTLQVAQSFIAEFLSYTSEFSVFGVGLPKAIVAKFLIDNQQKLHHRETNTFSNELYGTNLVLSHLEPLKPNGNILGFEILSYMYSNLDHSLLCNYLEREIFQIFGIRPNQYGLIQTYKDAMKIYEWMWEDENRGEPEPYYPWLIVQYPTT
ncbi:MAG: hypothetical protein GC179_04405 [Anaerolineaceae bacterium]|nr:hypothetical protein [Anaerolineaceae bacterium]